MKTAPDKQNLRICAVGEEAAERSILRQPPRGPELPVAIPHAGQGALEVSIRRPKGPSFGSPLGQSFRSQFPTRVRARCR